ncbi:MAG: hypothetical protein CMN31_04925 [Sandaracinus sp.]|nr:hypothetical protein [Sandaracinus sp.]MBJ70674.1 hypothetical protein [Sandaracinus sp.]
MRALLAIGAPQRAYHATWTRAWVEVIGLALAAGPAAEPDALFDRLRRHADAERVARSYRASTLESDAARRDWVAPDAGPLDVPWEGPPGSPALRWATADDLRAVRRLFEAYQRELGVDLCFQGFPEELAGLPGAYAPPDGALMVAERGGALVGCGALRPQPGAGPEVAEIKRLYVCPEARGGGLGRRMSLVLMAHARGLGYAQVVLDTLSRLEAACRLYEGLGFRLRPPYVPNPEPDVRYYTHLV